GDPGSIPRNAIRGLECFLLLAPSLTAQLLEVLQHTVRVIPHRGGTAFTADEHGLALDHALDRHAHRAEPVLRLHDAESLLLGQAAIFRTQLGQFLANLGFFAIAGEAAFAGPKVAHARHRFL